MSWEMCSVANFYKYRQRLFLTFQHRRREAPHLSQAGAGLGKTSSLGSLSPPVRRKAQTSGLTPPSASPDWMPTHRMKEKIITCSYMSVVRCGINMQSDRLAWKRDLHIF